MRIQEALSNCCQSIGTAASSAVDWMGRTLSATGAYLSDLMQRIATFVKPYFDQLVQFVQENQTGVMIAVVSVVLTTIACTVFRCCFNSSASTPAPAPAPAADSLAAFHAAMNNQATVDTANAAFAQLNAADKKELLDGFKAGHPNGKRATFNTEVELKKEILGGHFKKVLADFVAKKTPAPAAVAV